MSPGSGRILGGIVLALIGGAGLLPAVSRLVSGYDTVVTDSNGQVVVAHHSGADAVALAGLWGTLLFLIVGVWLIQSGRRRLNELRLPPL